jgi:hypothetical protein
MHRTGFEHALWRLIREMGRDRVAASGLVGLWAAGWLALVLAVFAPAA